MKLTWLLSFLIGNYPNSLTLWKSLRKRLPTPPLVRETEQRTTLPSLGQTALASFTGEANPPLIPPSSSHPAWLCTSSVTLLITAWKGAWARAQNLFPGSSLWVLGTFSCQQCPSTPILAAEQPPTMGVCYEIEHFQLAQLNYIKLRRICRV